MPTAPLQRIWLNTSFPSFSENFVKFQLIVFHKMENCLLVNHSLRCVCACVCMCVYVYMFVCVCVCVCTQRRIQVFVMRRSKRVHPVRLCLTRSVSIFAFPHTRTHFIAYTRTGRKEAGKDKTKLKVSRYCDGICVVVVR